MSKQSRFRVDSARFAHEDVDGEVIVIDMDAGTYFSMRDTAAAVFLLMVQGLPVDAAVGALATACSSEPGQIEAPVAEFIAQLASEAILVPRSDEPDAAEIPALPAMAFKPPALEKFTDMQDLLTLDPIHEVDETGWPHRAEPAG